MGAIVVSERATLEAALEEKLGRQYPLSAAQSSASTRLGGRSEHGKAESWRQQLVLRIEDVFLSQLYYRSGLLNTGFQNAVLQV